MISGGKNPKGVKFSLGEEDEVEYNRKLKNEDFT